MMRSSIPWDGASALINHDCFGGSRACPMSQRVGVLGSLWLSWRQHSYQQHRLYTLSNSSLKQEYIVVYTCACSRLLKQDRASELRAYSSHLQQHGQKQVKAAQLPREVTAAAQIQRDVTTPSTGASRT